jgi:dTDP-glucose 4,6-dehydratase
MTKRALVTGGAGFIGHHLVEHLMKNTDWEVVVLDRLDTSGNLNRLSEFIDVNEGYRRRFKFVFHDLKAELNSLVANEIGRVSHIFHLAASSHVDRSIENPMLFVQDNVVGTCNILNYARSVDSLEYFQNFSTDEVFGDAPEGVAYAEWDRHQPRNPYSATKSAADQLCYSFYNTYKLPVVVSNCMNVIGERQHPEKFMPMVMRKILRGETVQIHTDKDGVPGKRHYVHARNVAAACLFLVDHPTFGERYNFVGQVELDNLEIASKIAEVLGKELIYEKIDFHSSRPGHDLRYALLDTKMGAAGFEYPVSFDESFAKTIRWTLKNSRWLGL